MTNNRGVDYLGYYDSERFLFEVVGPSFRTTGRIKPEEFFLILIWKANRAKSKQLKRLAEIDNRGFSETVAEICSAISNAETPREKLLVLMKRWGFRLATATAILSVFYPDDFTVYDYRACEQLTALGCAEPFDRLEHLSPNTVWPAYERFVRAVRQAVPSQNALRAKDRYLWGKSLYEEIQNDIGLKG